MNLLPCPRSLRRRPGTFRLPARATLRLDASLTPDEARAIIKRLQSAAKGIGVKLILLRSSRRQEAQIFTVQKSKSLVTSAASENEESYTLTIDRRGVLIEYRQAGGLRAAIATLRQLLREYGRRLPCLTIRDWPDFSRRGIMLDISRGRVPKLETLLELVGHLADFKINEFQLYTEHTFAYRKYRSIWQAWGALTGPEMRKLDGRCRELGIDLVPNQNSFGHLRYWLEYPPLKKLAEVAGPYEDAGGFLRYPSTLAPRHPGTLPFVRRLYDELLPNFTSRRFNAGCDETWDLGRGQSKSLCAKAGKGRVYLNFLKQIHREIAARGRQMMFWGDIILQHPELIKALPNDAIALNWGYEADHPFEREAALFAKSGIAFYVCPGTSTWMTLIGRHDNAFANLRSAAKAGRRHGAAGYLIADWGDGGHPQPLAVSYAPYLAGAAFSWCGRTFDEKRLPAVLSRDVFDDRTGCIAKAALALGSAHRKFHHVEPNLTPFGAVIAAPPPHSRELFCRDGLKYHARISGKHVCAAKEEVQKQLGLLCGARPSTRSGKVLQRELELAARMAVQSCQIMLWQQALAAGKSARAHRLAQDGLRELRNIGRNFKSCWPLRNKGTPAKCAAFLHWRIEELRQSALHDHAGPACGKTC